MNFHLIGHPGLRWVELPLADKQAFRRPRHARRRQTNKYAFDLGGGAETIVVDGSYQPGCCGTKLSVKPEAADTWIVERKKDGRLLLRATWKLSKDQSTLTDYYREFEADGETHSMDYVNQRTGSGGSGFAADWQSIKETMNSPYVIEVKAFDGDGLSFITPSDHQTENVKFDGKDYPNEGPNVGPGVTFSMRRVDERNLEMTNKADGKVIETDEIGLSADRKTLTITKHIPGHDKPIVMVFERKGPECAIHSGNFRWGIPLTQSQFVSNSALASGTSARRTLLTQRLFRLTPALGIHRRGNFEGTFTEVNADPPE